MVTAVERLLLAECGPVVYDLAFAKKVPSSISSKNFVVIKFDW